ncbi:DUF2690 domain-containing protein [Streptomyces sp. NPDC006307]|uniref:DUF2690 domain-containing protein n=1 Tax=Streptomyces sp. NPDC006307 TaxID=3156748 RepID=UPI0033B6A5D7
MATGVVATAAVLGLGLGGPGTLVLPRGGDGSPAPDPSPVESGIRNPGCAGASCEGRDPKDMGCGGTGMVSTVAARTAADGQRVELRRGEDCRAVWVRATGLRAGDRVELTMPGGRTQRIVATGPRATEGYLATPMAAADAPGTAGARVCLLPARGDRECFG